MMTRFRPIRSLAAVAAAAALIAGCTTLPTNTEPQAIRSFEPPVEQPTNLGPQPGREPDLLLRDFYSASARPTQDYVAARSYLAPGTADRWDPRQSTLVVDRIDLITQAGPTAERRAFDVRASVIGRINTGGSYVPENGTYEATITMERNDEDEWRITSLPSGIVLERTELRNQYQPHRVFFLDPSDTVLVGDRRWIHSDHQGLDTALISLLMQGPSQTLAPAVNNPVPADATFAGVTDGIYNFTGFTGVDPDARLRFAAQLVWTLALANIPEPYAVQMDGAPVAPGFGELTSDDFAEYNPTVSATSNVPLFALTDGIVHRVGSNTVEPLEGDLGSIGDLTSVDISQEGAAAAVRRQGDEFALLAGTVDGPMEEALTAETISRPTFELDPDSQWVVIDGRTVVRVVYSGATDEFSRSDVDISALEGLSGDISVLRLHRTGTRVAMIIEGRVFTGVVTRSGPIERRIDNVVELAPQLAGTALSLDWQPDGSIIVGTSTPETPVWRVEQDGSAITSLPGGNVTAPVVAVAASPSTVFITDARAVLQLPTDGSDTVFWREVAGLQGVRSAPIVAN